jgi:hypothetical protein
MEVVQNCAMSMHSEIFDQVWYGSEGFACEDQGFSAGFCEALAVEQLAAPPGLEDDICPRGLALRLDGLPLLLRSEDMLEAMLEQVGFDKLLLGQPTISAGNGSCGAMLTVTSFEAAVAIAEHFQGCNWNGCEKVTVTALLAEVPRSNFEERTGMQSSACEFVPGTLWCSKGLPSASASTTASSSNASDIDLCSEHEEV